MRRFLVGSVEPRLCLTEGFAGARPIALAGSFAFRLWGARLDYGVRHHNKELRGRAAIIVVAEVRSMKVVLSGCAVLLIALMTTPGYATERLVPYDDFNATHLDPNKWVGFESGGTGTEAIRQIEDNRLRLVYRGYAQETSDTGSLTANLGVAFPHPAARYRHQGDGTVSHLDEARFLRHPQGTLTAARLGGYFFNTATPTPGSAVHDVRAVIGIARRLDSTDPPDILG